MKHQMSAIEAAWVKLKCLELVEGTPLKCRDVVRRRSLTNIPLAFRLETHAFEDVELAVGVCADKPVWKESVLFSDNGTAYHMSEQYVPPRIMKKLHWDKPVSGEEFPIVCTNTGRTESRRTVFVELSVDVAKSFEEQYRNLRPHRRDVEDAIKVALHKLEIDRIARSTTHLKYGCNLDGQHVSSEPTQERKE